MKQRYSLLIAGVLFACSMNAQAFWTEDFTNGCTAGCTGASYTGSNGAWTQTVTGTEGTDPNDWFVSCAENGNGAGMCGSGCGSAANATLHISAGLGNPFCPNDCGAAYDAGGLCGTLTCPQTSRRIESPTINCSTTTSAVSVSFVYIAAGSIPNDQCSLWYFDGNTWTLVQALPATNNANCGGQGLWTNITIALPASAIGNANVKIGFEWVNNDDGVGTDPSVAIDDVQLGVQTGITAPAITEAKVIYDAAGDVISVNTGMANGTSVTAELYSVDGRLMLSQQLNETVSAVSVESLASGAYVLHLTAEGKNFLPVKLVLE